VQNISELPSLEEEMDSSIGTDDQEEDDVMKLFNKGMRSVLDVANVKENHDYSNGSEYGVKKGPRAMTFMDGERPKLKSSNASKASASKKSSGSKESEIETSEYSTESEHEI
jgi:hypothetical protein